MAQDKIVKTDYVKDALLTNVNDDIEELYTITAGKAAIAHTHGAGGIVSFGTGTEIERLAYSPMGDMLWYQYTDMYFYFYDFSEMEWVLKEGLRIADTDNSHYLTLDVGSNLAADRVLTFTTGDSDRTITLTGDPTIGDWLDQSVKTTGSPTFAGLTLDTELLASIEEVNTVCNGVGAKNSHTHDHSTKATAYTSDGTWIRPSNVTGIWAILVGGGGGGSYRGGGGGGQVIFRQLEVTGNVYVTLGAGGTGKGAGFSGDNGTNSQLSSGTSLTSLGGTGADSSGAGGRGGGATGGTGGAAATTPAGQHGMGSFGGADGGGGGGADVSEQNDAGGCPGFGVGGHSAGGLAGGGGSYGYGASYNSTPAANSGGGGSAQTAGTGSNGGSGYCIIMHVE